MALLPKNVREFGEGLQLDGREILLFLALREAARMVDQDVSRQVEQNPEVQALVRRLEKNFDEHASTEQRSLLVTSDDAVPDAEELGAAAEAYLRSQPDTTSGEGQEPGSTPSGS